MSFSFYKPGAYSCGSKGGNCGGQWARSSVTRYVVCGTRDRFVIQTVLNEGEIQQDLLGFKTEKILTGTRQMLKLLSKNSVSERISLPSRPVKLDSLVYKYSMKKTIGEEVDTEIQESGTALLKLIWPKT